MAEKAPTSSTNGTTNGSHSKPAPPTPMEILIVGSGFAGLTAGIEFRRRGWNVTLLEGQDTRRQLGDSLSFGPNATKVFKKWPGIPEKMQKVCQNIGITIYSDYTGKHIFTHDYKDERDWGPWYFGHRALLHEIVWDYAIELGVDIRLGHRVTEYFEEDGLAGVVANGERFTADLIVAADGVRSAARKLVLGYQDMPDASGYAVYRTWYPADEVAKIPELAYITNGDMRAVWMGTDVHFMCATTRTGKDICWVLTHKDEADIKESWNYPGRVEDAVRLVEDWDPRVAALIRTTPPDKLVDWKLVYRVAINSWSSPKGRIILIGDAAHPFLPTSAQGASQAVEDAVTLAVCLDLAGPDNIPQAVRATERIRFKRVKKVQATGVSTRQKWHRLDWDRVNKDPSSVKQPRPHWVVGFDAEAHAHNIFADVVEEMQKEDENMKESTQLLPAA